MHQAYSVRRAVMDPIESGRLPWIWLLDTSLFTEKDTCKCKDAKDQNYRMKNKHWLRGLTK